MADPDVATLGESEYLESCALCHGADGKGGGALAPHLNTAVPDLTGLAAANGGVFPVSRIYSIIDGTQASGVHGSREMPAWGTKYSLQAEGEMKRFSLGFEDRRRAFIRRRILALIEHLASLQER